MSSVLGEIELEGYRLRQNVLSMLAIPIREWFHEHPEEDGPAGYYFVHLEREPEGIYRCHLDVVGRHHWSSSGDGKTLRTALQNSLEGLTPDFDLSQSRTENL